MDESQQLPPAPTGRSVPGRSDSRTTRANLIAAVHQWVELHGGPPGRLADVAEIAEVSTATAYRHFASVDDVIQAFVRQLPTRAIELFKESVADSELTPNQRLQRWNEVWVTSCLEHGPLAVYLRSATGFIERRLADDPLIAYTCSEIEPILDDLECDRIPALFIWNVTSDPREVLDLTALGWSPQQIATFITQMILATPKRP